MFVSVLESVSVHISLFESAYICVLESVSVHISLFESACVCQCVGECVSAY